MNQRLTIKGKSQVTQKSLFLLVIILTNKIVQRLLCQFWGMEIYLVIVSYLFCLSDGGLS